MTTRLGMKIALSGVAAAVYLPAASAGAQNLNAAPPAQQVNQSQVQEVVITAQRREENLQKVPLAVSAFSATALDQRVVQNSTQLLEFVPNVVAFNNGNQQGQANYYFRGLGTPDGLQTFDSPVVTYVDEVPLGRIGGANVNFLDLAQVEVLRGPQGTLFGRNVSGGAVLYTTQKPTKDFGLSGQVEAGTRSHIDVRGTVDAPVTDKLFTSFNFYDLHEDGYLRSVYNNNHYNGESSYGFRGAMRYDPIPKVEWNASIDYSRQDGSAYGSLGQQNVPAGVVVSNANNEKGTAFDNFQLIDTTLGDCETGSSHNAIIWAQNHCSAAVAVNGGITSNVRWAAADHVVLNFITGLRYTGEDYSLDFSGRGPGTAATGLNLYDLANNSDFKQFSQEIKATGDIFSGRVRYVGGVFFFHEDDKSRIDTIYDYPKLGFNVPTDLDSAFLRNATTSYAGYLQADTLITDKLTLTTGYRYTYDVKRVGIDFDSHTPLYKSYTTAQISGDPDFGAYRGTPKASLQYQVTPKVMTYVSYTNGFVSGGWSGRSTTAAGFDDFRDEKVDSYELGARTEFFDRRLRLNATLFRANYRGLQINTAFALPNGTQVYVTGNAGDAFDEGLELESQFVLLRGLTGTLNLGLQDSRYTKLTSGAVAQSGFVIGSHLSQTPPASLSGGLSWAHDWSAIHGSTTLSGDFQYLPPYDPTITASSITIEPVVLLNAQLVYQPYGSHFQFALECRNCTQDVSIIATSHAGGGVLDSIPFAGVRVRYKM